MEMFYMITYILTHTIVCYIRERHLFCRSMHLFDLAVLNDNTIALA